MPIRLTDHDINTLILELKPLVPNWRQKLVSKPKRGHNEVEMDIDGSNGSRFRVIIRQSKFSSLDCSVILAYQLPNTNRLFILRRYNGKSHTHTNNIEGETFFDFHIHTATERYQARGFRPEHWGTPTDRYADLEGALECMISDCGFITPEDNQLHLF